MIQNISIENFKIFKHKTSFPLSSINLLTGINGRGKSSFLQTLLLIQQSLALSPNLTKVVLNGSNIELGNFSDLRNHQTSRDKPILLQYQLDTHENISIELSEDDIDDTVAKVRLAPTTLLPTLQLFERIHFIAADRNGPQELYIKTTLPNFLTVGKKGEFVGNVLLQRKDFADIYETLILPHQEASLLPQIGAWLSEILDTENVIIDINHLGGRVIVLNFLFRNNSNKLKPENVGFGYSYILPILISGLIARQGEIIIIENPEAHLHPKAQNRLSKFLTKVASCGIQIFIESHSEHILNGLRVASLENNDNMKITNNLNILYFQDDVMTPFVKLNILRNGKIENWPEGFFDQQEQDLANIFKLGRRLT